MSVWKEYSLSIIICVVFGGILSGLVSNSRKKSLIDMICGTVLAVTVLRPISGVQLQKLHLKEIANDYKLLAQEYVAMGEASARNEKMRYIKSACSEYISCKANALGTDVTSEIYLDEEMVPIRVEITGDFAKAAQDELATMLERDLGVTKENQVWIWMKEEKKS